MATETDIQESVGLKISEREESLLINESFDETVTELPSNKAKQLETSSLVAETVNTPLETTKPTEESGTFFQALSVPTVIADEHNNTPESCKAAKQPEPEEEETVENKEKAIENEVCAEDTREKKEAISMLEKKQGDSTDGAIKETTAEQHVTTVTDGETEDKSVDAQEASERCEIGSEKIEEQKTEESLKKTEQDEETEEIKVDVETEKREQNGFEDVSVLEEGQDKDDLGSTKEVTFERDLQEKNHHSEDNEHENVEATGSIEEDADVSVSTQKEVVKESIKNEEPDDGKAIEKVPKKAELEGGIEIYAGVVPGQTETINILEKNQGDGDGVTSSQEAPCVDVEEAAVQHVTTVTDFKEPDGNEKFREIIMEETEDKSFDAQEASKESEKEETVTTDVCISAQTKSQAEKTEHEEEEKSGGPTVKEVCDETDSEKVVDEHTVNKAATAIINEDDESEVVTAEEIIEKDTEVIVSTEKTEEQMLLNSIPSNVCISTQPEPDEKSTVKNDEEAIESYDGLTNENETARKDEDQGKQQEIYMSEEGQSGGDDVISSESASNKDIKETTISQHDTTVADSETGRDLSATQREILIEKADEKTVDAQEEIGQYDDGTNGEVEQKPEVSIKETDSYSRNEQEEYTEEIKSSVNTVEENDVCISTQNESQEEATKNEEYDIESDLTKTETEAEIKLSDSSEVKTRESVDADTEETKSSDDTKESEEKQGFFRSVYTYVFSSTKTESVAKSTDGEGNNDEETTENEVSKEENLEKEEEIKTSEVQGDVSKEAFIDSNETTEVEPQEDITPANTLETSTEDTSKLECENLPIEALETVSEVQIPELVPKLEDSVPKEEKETVAKEISSDEKTEVQNGALPKEILKEEAEDKSIDADEISLELRETNETISENPEDEIKKGDKDLSHEIVEDTHDDTTREETCTLEQQNDDVSEEIVTDVKETVEVEPQEDIRSSTLVETSKEDTSFSEKEKADSENLPIEDLEIVSEVQITKEISNDEKTEPTTEIKHATVEEVCEEASSEKAEFEEGLKLSDSSDIKINEEAITTFKDDDQEKDHAVNMSTESQGENSVTSSQKDGYEEKEDLQEHDLTKTSVGTKENTEDVIATNVYNSTQIQLREETIENEEENGEKAVEYEENEIVSREENIEKKQDDSEETKVVEHATTVAYYEEGDKSVEAQEVIHVATIEQEPMEEQSDQGDVSKETIIDSNATTEVERQEDSTHANPLETSTEDTSKSECENLPIENLETVSEVQIPELVPKLEDSVQKEEFSISETETHLDEEKETVAKEISSDEKTEAQGGAMPKELLKEEAQDKSIDTDEIFLELRQTSETVTENPEDEIKKGDKDLSHEIMEDTHDDTTREEKCALEQQTVEEHSDQDDVLTEMVTDLKETIEVEPQEDIKSSTLVETSTEDTSFLEKENAESEKLPIEDLETVSEVQIPELVSKSEESELKEECFISEVETQVDEEKKTVMKDISSDEKTEPTAEIKHATVEEVREETTSEKVEFEDGLKLSEAITTFEDDDQEKDNVVNMSAENQGENDITSSQKDVYEEKEDLQEHDLTKSRERVDEDTEEIKTSIETKENTEDVISTNVCSSTQIQPDEETIENEQENGEKAVEYNENETVSGDENIEKKQEDAEETKMSEHATTVAYYEEGQSQGTETKVLGEEEGDKSGVAQEETTQYEEVANDETEQKPEEHTNEIKTSVETNEEHAIEGDSDQKVKSDNLFVNEVHEKNDLKNIEYEDERQVSDSSNVKTRESEGAEETESSDEIKENMKQQAEGEEKNDEVAVENDGQNEKPESPLVEVLQEETISETAEPEEEIRQSDSLGTTPNEDETLSKEEKLEREDEIRTSKVEGSAPTEEITETTIEEHDTAGAYVEKREDVDKSINVKEMSLELGKPDEQNVEDTNPCLSETISENPKDEIKKEDKDLSPEIVERASDDTTKEEKCKLEQDEVSKEEGTGLNETAELESKENITPSNPLETSTQDTTNSEEEKEESKNLPIEDFETVSEVELPELEPKSEESVLKEECFVSETGARSDEEKDTVTTEISSDEQKDQTSEIKKETVEEICEETSLDKAGEFEEGLKLSDDSNVKINDKEITSFKDDDQEKDEEVNKSAESQGEDNITSSQNEVSEEKDDLQEKSEETIYNEKKNEEGVDVNAITKEVIDEEADDKSVHAQEVSGDLAQTKEENVEEIQACLTETIHEAKEDDITKKDEDLSYDGIEHVNESVSKEKCFPDETTKEIEISKLDHEPLEEQNDSSDEVSNETISNLEETSGEPQEDVMPSGSLGTLTEDASNTEAKAESENLPIEDLESVSADSPLTEDGSNTEAKAESENLPIEDLKSVSKDSKVNEECLISATATYADEDGIAAKEIPSDENLETHGSTKQPEEQIGDINPLYENRDMKENVTQESQLISTEDCSEVVKDVILTEKIEQVPLEVESETGINDFKQQIVEEDSYSAELEERSSPDQKEMISYSESIPVENPEVTEVNVDAQIGQEDLQGKEHFGCVSKVINEVDEEPKEETVASLVESSVDLSNIESTAYPSEVTNEVDEEAKEERVASQEESTTVESPVDLSNVESTAYPSEVTNQVDQEPQALKSACDVQTPVVVADSEDSKEKEECIVFTTSKDTDENNVEEQDAGTNDISSETNKEPEYVTKAPTKSDEAESSELLTEENAITTENLEIHGEFKPISDLVIDEDQVSTETKPQSEQSEIISENMMTYQTLESKLEHTSSKESEDSKEEITLAPQNEIKIIEDQNEAANNIIFTDEVAVKTERENERNETGQVLEDDICATNVDSTSIPKEKELANEVLLEDDKPTEESMGHGDMLKLEEKPTEDSEIATKVDEIVHCGSQEPSEDNTLLSQNDKNTEEPDVLSSGEKDVIDGVDERSEEALVIDVEKHEKDLDHEPEVRISDVVSNVEAVTPVEDVKTSTRDLGVPSAIDTTAEKENNKTVEVHDARKELLKDSEHIESTFDQSKPVEEGFGIKQEPMKVDAPEILGTAATKDLITETQTHPKIQKYEAPAYTADKQQSLNEPPPKESTVKIGSSYDQGEPVAKSFIPEAANLKVESEVKTEKGKLEVAENLTGERDLSLTKDQQVEKEETDEEEYEDEDNEEDDEKMGSISDAPVMVEASRDMDTKVHKKSHNILSGVGSKVKHSIAKVRKAITGKSSPPKSPAKNQVIG